MSHDKKQTNCKKAQTCQERQASPSSTLMGYRQDNWQSANHTQKEAVETNQDEGITAPEESDIEPEEEGETTEEIEEEAPKADEPEEIEETLEVSEVSEEISEEKAAEEEAEETLEEEIAEEEEKVERKEKIEEEIVEERIYTIPLGRAWIASRKKRTPQAVRLVKAFIQRHMKPETLVMSNEVNERLWSRSIQKPPRKIRVRAVRDTEGTVTLYMAEGD